MAIECDGIRLARCPSCNGVHVELTDDEGNLKAFVVIAIKDVVEIAKALQDVAYAAAVEREG